MNEELKYKNICQRCGRETPYEFFDESTELCVDCSHDLEVEEEYDNAYDEYLEENFDYDKGDWKY